MTRMCRVIFIFISWKLCIVNGKQMFKETTTFENAADPIRADPINEIINLSMPGTKWCGPGNTATDYHDLGELLETDKCCRDHDHCDSMAFGETKGNLINIDYFTKLHCDCDRQFYHCLHKINTEVSNSVGNVYFGLRSECYRKEYPIVKCLEYDTAGFIKRCHRYILD